MYVDGESWGSFITDNTSVSTVVSSWSPAASAVGRTSTANRIEIQGTKAGQYYITIDNLWSSFIDSGTSRITGGLSFYPTVNSAHATVYLKGNSRFGNIHYSSDFDNTHIIFEDGSNGTVTVASFNGSSNHYNSVIGGNDSGAAGKENSKGIVINGGTIFAGAQVKDNCTAIGGGGNGHGIVTINGGVVTAVVSSSGAAIGGGIGESSQGGRATIYLNGGQIYAYNFGFISEKSEGNFPIPAAAIGGGSTCLSEGTMADIFITGGNIYARSVGGAAIGGGSSTTKKGGSAKIVISGNPVIDALSVGGVVHAKSGLKKTVEPGISIGGGTAGAGGTANGGYADLTISGGILKTGSIGGGACNNKSGKFGHAIVNITNGDIQGQIIMEEGTADCVFNMSGGTINNLDSGSYNFIKKDGGAVYINDPKGKATISAGTIINCSAENGGAVYMSRGSFTLSGGTITASKASNFGGAVYLGGGTVSLSGGTISDCSSITGGAIYLAGGNVDISGTTISSCYAEHSDSALGGAIYVTGGDVFMSEGTITNCYTAKPGEVSYVDRINGLGGALYITGGKMEMTGGTIIDCSATAGGAIYLPGGNFDMTGGKISSNDATGNGGGVYLAGGDLTIDGEFAIIEQNSAVNGAGVYLTGGTPGLYCGTLSGNIASGNGGGIFIDKQVVVLQPTGTVTFDGNQAIDGAGMYILGDQNTPAGFSVDDTAWGSVVFSGNIATGNGGGVCLSYGDMTVTNEQIQLFGNKAENGGGAAVLNGSFALSGGSVGVTAESPNTATNGGGIYVSGGNVTVSGTGTLTNNGATYGGGVYLTGGNFTLDGEVAYIKDNIATYGGGVYLTQINPSLLAGNIINNIAVNSGGGIFIDKQVVNLKPTGTVTFNGNQAVNGAGMYILGDAEIPAGFTVDECLGRVVFSFNVATANGGGVCIDNGIFTISYNNIDIINNIADNGGGVAVLSGNFDMHSGVIGENGKSNVATNGGGVYVAGGVATINGGTVSNNTAVNGGGAYVSGGNLVLNEGGAFYENSVTYRGSMLPNGGGFYVYNGSFTMNGGIVSRNTAIGGNGGGVYVAGGVATINGGIVSNNTAANGGGAYVSGGNLVLNEGGSFYENSAAYSGGIMPNGGGFYVYNGSFTMNGGIVTRNTAIGGNGGGGYIDGGNFVMKNGTIGGNSLLDANTAVNGGGIYVSDGNVTIQKGNISYNHAEQDGGGIYVSSETTDVNVIFLSGNLVNNYAISGNGGGMAVQSISGQTITVKIGCLLYHPKDLFGNVVPFDYVGEYAQYAADGQHESCPYVAGNVAALNGGGFYINSSSSCLYYFCIEEDEMNPNVASGNTSCYSLDVEGGRVIIGDQPYHDYPNLRSEAWGNVRMYSTILVNDGAVDIYGDMDNPYFAQKITVDIKSPTGHFFDHRREKDAVTYYKIHYWENFQGGGKYIASQYPVSQGECWVDISGAMFERPGYKIVGWITHNNVEYLVGSRIDLTKLAAADGMGLTNSTCTCQDDDYCLVLYAVWAKKGYVIQFNPNTPYGATYTGQMDYLPCTQGESVELLENQFKCAGYKFLGWALTPYATKIDFADKAKVKDLTLEDSKLVPLYAVWGICNHVGTLKYTVENGSTIVESCEECGGHTAYAHLEAHDVDYDAQPHPATVSGDFGSQNWLGPVPSVLYVKDNDPAWDDEDSDQVWATWKTQTPAVPKYAGTYTASLTVGDATANVRFTIERIKWGAPSVPDIVTATVDGKKGVQIIPPEVDESLVDKPTYEYSSERILNGTVESNSPWSTDKFIPTEHSNTYYYIYARLKADRNHIESDSSQYIKYLSDTASVEFLLDTGIVVTKTNIEGNNNFTFMASPETGYHKNNWSVTVYTENPYNNSEAQGSGLTPDDNDQYILNLASSDVTYYIRIKGVTVNAEFASKATYDQVFVNFTGVQSFIISRDSSFTVQYTMKNFTPSEYEAPSLKFYAGDQPASIPSGTKVILVNDGSYWYCVTSSAASSLKLTDFKKMGGLGDFVCAKGDLPINTTYQFVFDFSDAQSMPIGNGLSVQFAAESPVEDATELDMVCEIGLADEATFKFDVTLDNKATIQYTYNKSNGHASIWNNREAAITIKLEGEIPADIIASVAFGGQYTDYKPHDGNLFIIPCGALVDGVNSIEVEFKSELINVLDLKSVLISWIVSDTIADKAPLNGTEVGKALFENKSLTLSEAPALRITGITAMDSDVGEIRLCQIDSSYQVTVVTQNIPKEWELTMYLYRKDTTVGSASEGQFIYTGFYQVLSEDTKPELSLRGQEEGTFYLYVVATKGKDANRVIMLEDKYFFIAEE